VNINYLLKDWAWRVNDGMPDPKNRNHLELLEATLRAHKYSEEFINAYISEIEFNTSKDLAKYKAKHKMRKTTKVKIGGEETTVGDAEKKDKAWVKALKIGTTLLSGGIQGVYGGKREYPKINYGKKAEEPTKDPESGVENDVSTKIDKKVDINNENIQNE